MDILAEIIEKTENADGTLPEGFLFASLKNTGNQAVVVNEVPLQPGEAKSYPFIGKGYQMVSYQVNGSSLKVMYIL